jgi:hypothetical protein
MRQHAWIAACALAAGLVAAGVAPVAAAKAKTASKSTNDTRQFTGYVVALDKTTITVEKRGEKPRTLVFTRDDEMKTTGDLEKDARVTVYYREDDGELTAQRVVVKPASGAKTKSASGSRSKPKGGR